MGELKIADYTTSQLDDQTVVKRVLAGERELFEILMRRYNQTLFRVLRSYLMDRVEIQDVMQNTYLKAFHKLFQFHGDSAFSTWLIRIGINEALLRLRDIRKERNLYNDSVETNSNTVALIPDKQMNPETVLFNADTRHLLERAIDELPEKYRVIFVLKEIQGLEHSQISDCLGITESNVKVRLHRARTLMKNALYKISSGSEVFEFGNKDCNAVVDFVMKNI